MEGWDFTYIGKLLYTAKDFKFCLTSCVILAPLEDKMLDLFSRTAFTKTYTTYRLENEGVVAHW